METLFRKTGRNRSSNNNNNANNSNGHHASSPTELGGVPYNQLQPGPQPVAGPSNYRRTTTESLIDQISPPTSNPSLSRESNSMPRTPVEKPYSALPSGRDFDAVSILSTSTAASNDTYIDMGGRFPDLRKGPPSRVKMSPVPGMQLLPTPTKSGDREVFSFERPPDEKVDELFNQMIESRDIPGFQRQSSIMGAVANVAMDLKWQLVEADARKRYSEAKLKEQELQTAGKRGASSIKEKSPEWYLKHMMEQNVTRDVLGGLAVSLRTEPIK